MSGRWARRGEGEDWNRQERSGVEVMGRVQKTPERRNRTPAHVSMPRELKSRPSTSPTHSGIRTTAVDSGSASASKFHQLFHDVALLKWRVVRQVVLMSRIAREFACHEMK